MSLSEVVPSTLCNETCNPSSSGNFCGGRRGSISAYTYNVIASNSLAIETKNFRGENVSDYATYPVMTGEVSSQLFASFTYSF